MMVEMGVMCEHELEFSSADEFGTRYKCKLCGELIEYEDGEELPII